MSARRVDLTTPLKEDAVRDLRLGDHVYLSGELFTGRSRFHQQAIDENAPPPIDFRRINVLMHIGPVFKRDQRDEWRVVGFDQTSSIRFERWEPQAIRRFGLRAIIGKTTMGRATAEAMRQNGCVHLTRVGVPGNLLAQSVRRVLDVFNLQEFGMTEATWVIQVENLGPFIVDIDTAGNNLFDDVRRGTESKMRRVYARFGIPEGFQYGKALPGGFSDARG